MQHWTLLAALSAPRYVLKKETEPPNLVTGFFVYGHHVGYHPATRRGVASYPRPVDRHDSACHARRARVIVSRRPTRSALQSSRSFWRSLRCSSQRASCPRFPASSSNNSATVSVQVLFSLRCARMITPMLAAYLPRPISANRKAMDASCGFTPGWSPGRCISRPRFIHERRHLVGINSPHHIADAIGADPKPNRDGAPRARRLLRRSEARGWGDLLIALTAHGINLPNQVSQRRAPLQFDLVPRRLNGSTPAVRSRTGFHCHRRAGLLGQHTEQLVPRHSLRNAARPSLVEP